MKFAVGQPVTRIEDIRFITGQGQFTDDLKLPEMVHGAFVRSPYAHANIKNINIPVSSDNFSLISKNIPTIEPK